VVRYWHGYLSEASCKLFAYGLVSDIAIFVLKREVKLQLTNCIWSSWCHCHPIISCSSKIQNGLPFWCRLARVVVEKRPLSGCSSSSSSSYCGWILLSHKWH